MSHTRLVIHIVFATKARRPIISGAVEKVLHRELWEIPFRIGGQSFAVGGTEDHAHVVAAVPATLSVSQYVAKLKANSSRRVREKFPNLDFRWQEGYGAFTVSPFDMEGVVEYVENQKEHHATGTVADEFETIACPRANARGT